MTITITKRGYWCLRVVYTSCQGLESDGRNFLAAIVLCRPKNQNVNHTYCHYDYRLDYECYFLGAKFQNSKLFYHFCYTECLPQVRLLLWVCHKSVNVSGNVIMLVEMAIVMLVVQCSQ
jgi:hypothetical protein